MFGSVEQIREWCEVDSHLTRPSQSGKQLDWRTLWGEGDRVSDWRWASAWALKKKGKEGKGEKKEGKRGKERKRRKRREEEKKRKEERKEKKVPQSVMHTSAFSCFPVLSLSPRGTLGR